MLKAEIQTFFITLYDLVFTVFNFLQTENEIHIDTTFKTLDYWRLLCGGCLAGVRVFIAKKAQLTLLGTEMDFVESKLSSEFVFNNPNIKGTCGCGESFNIWASGACILPKPPFFQPCPVQKKTERLKCGCGSQIWRIPWDADMPAFWFLLFLPASHIRTRILMKPKFSHSCLEESFDTIR